MKSYCIDEEDEKRLVMETITLPYLIVLSQDCDLESDFNKREVMKKDFLNDKSKKQCYNKFLDSILICPAFPAEDLREGLHLKGMERIVERINSKEWDKVKKNDNYRYHYLDEETIKKDRKKEVIIPQLAVDFKKYYTIPRNYLYFYKKTNYKASLNELIREDISNRFAYFQSRIGLPVF
jgi:hypothetical protein